MAVNNSNVKHLEEKIESLQENVIKKDKQIAELTRQLDDMTRHRHTLHEIKNSKSYLVGRSIMFIPRAFKKIYNVSRHNLGLIKNINKLKKRIDKIYGIERGGNKIRVDVYIRSYYHPTSSTFIRMISPFSSPVLQSIASISLLDGEHPKFRKAADIIVVQRTAISHMEDAVRLVKHVRDNDIKLFIDTDDAFGELDENHPQYLLQKERVDALNHIINNADEAWFSTSVLQKLYAIKSSKVIRNTLDYKIWPKLKAKTIIPPPKKSPLRIVYMGTVTHDKDFELIIPVFEKLYRETPGKFDLYMIGVSANLNQYPWVKTLTPDSALYPDFVKWFSDLPQFDIGLSPIVDNSFNSSKSDIKCLDYLANGIKPIVSDVVAYKNPELDEHIVRVNNNLDNWYDALKYEIDNTISSRKMMSKRASRGFDYINNYRSIDIPAQKIRESIEEGLTSR